MTTRQRQALHVVDYAPQRAHRDEIEALTAPGIAAHRAKRAALREPELRPLARTERGRRWALGACAAATVILLADTAATYGWRGVAVALGSLTVALLVTGALRKAETLWDRR